MRKQWWHGKNAYQIYPKSFYDMNGDGVGDIQGIIKKLDYIKGLGIDILWISPMYPSPMKDNGYDISDYYGVDAQFGTMEDMEQLIAEVKKRGMHLILDLVVNHCSNQHKWFQEALRNPEGKYGKYFYFKEGKKGKEPNNWRSYFGGSVWEPVPGRQNLFYLHFFAKEQPDLNWENQELREEIYQMVNWWLEKGIDGFRIDAIINIKKDLSWDDLPVDGPDGRGIVWKSVKRASGIGDFLSELRDRCFLPHQAFTVGEVFNVKDEMVEEFIGENGYFSTMFAFDPCQAHRRGVTWAEYMPSMPLEEWKKETFRNQKLLGEDCFWATVLENHDQPRGASLFIPAQDYGFVSLSALAMIQVCERGIPFIYQGQEIGMTNCSFVLSEYDDLSTIDQYHFMLEKGYTEKEAIEACNRESRDNCRTPMQWSNEVNAGFTKGTPWLKVNPNYKNVNVEKQEKEYASLLNFYRRLLAFRKSEEYNDILTYGKFEPIFESEKDIFAYKRSLEKKALILISNFSGKEKRLAIPFSYDNVVFVNLERLTAYGDTLHLQPYQTIVLESELVR